MNKRQRNDDIDMLKQLTCVVIMLIFGAVTIAGVSAIAHLSYGSTITLSLEQILLILGMTVMGLLSLIGVNCVYEFDKRYQKLKEANKNTKSGQGIKYYACEKHKKQINHLYDYKEIKMTNSPSKDERFNTLLVEMIKKYPALEVNDLEDAMKQAFNLKIHLCIDQAKFETKEQFYDRLENYCLLIVLAIPLLLY